MAAKILAVKPLRGIGRDAEKTLQFPQAILLAAENFQILSDNVLQVHSGGHAKFEPGKIRYGGTILQTNNALARLCWAVEFLFDTP